MKKEKSATLAAMIGNFGAVGVGGCCVLPLFFVSIGLGGSWLGYLTALAPYQPIFLVMSLGALGYGFWQVWRVRSAQKICADGTCAKPLVPLSLLLALMISGLVLTLVFWLYPLYVLYFG